MANRRRFLVLAHRGDRTAAAVFTALRRRFGSGDVTAVSASDLFGAPRWAHRPVGEGDEIELRSAICIRPEEIRAVFNRIVDVEVPTRSRLTGDDRDYAMSELYALIQSWLGRMGDRVVNRGGARGLGAPRISPFEWLRSASRAGLDTARVALVPPRQPSPAWSVSAFEAARLFDGIVNVVSPISRHVPARSLAVHLDVDVRRLRDVLVLGQSIFGAPDDMNTDAFVSLASETGCPLMSAKFAPDRSGAWRFVTANPFPHSDRDDHADAIVDVLVERSR